MQLHATAGLAAGVEFVFRLPGTAADGKTVDQNNN